MNQKIQDFQNSMRDKYTHAFQNAQNKTIHRDSLDYAAGCVETCDKLIHDHAPVLPDSEPEFFGQIIDIFEDFLDAKGVQIANTDRDEDIADGEDPEGLAIIYGEDYDIIKDQLTSMMQHWHIINTKGD